MIRTERLVLRQGKSEDLEPLHTIFSDPRAMRYWDRPAHDDIVQTAAFLENFMRGDPENRLEFILDHNGECVGKAGMWAKPEVGFILHPKLWRMGYVSEAMDVIIPMIWNRFPDLGHLTAELDPRNDASAALLRKLGFTCVETKEKNFLYGDTEWCDTAYYVLDRPNDA